MYSQSRHARKSSRAPLVLILLGVVCAGISGGTAQAATGTTQQGIVGGVLSPGEQGIVALTYLGQQFCTGTVIHPRVVLTAAHCVDPLQSPPIADVRIIYEASVTTSAPQGLVTDVVYHADWQTAPASDLGLLLLAEDAPTRVVPLLARAFDASFVGRELRLIGYGITKSEARDNGSRREGVGVIQSFNDHVFYMALNGSDGTCNGDSGGPALLVEHGVELLTGVHSRSDCLAMAMDVRVDAHIDEFIAPTLRDWVGDTLCKADDRCDVGCENGDPDCPCAADGECALACPYLAMDPDCVGVPLTCDGNCGGAAAAGASLVPGCHIVLQDGNDRAPWSAWVLAGVSLILVWRRRRSQRADRVRRPAR